MLEKRVFLSIGSNLGDRALHLSRALDLLDAQHIAIVSRSSLYETEPRDMPARQPWFLNMAAECRTRLFPLQLLKVLHSIERDLGRARPSAAQTPAPRIPQPRTIDLDILLFGNTVMHTPRLTVPHPRMFERRFVLEPLLEIAPDLRRPDTKEPLHNYLAGVASQKLRKFVGV